MGAKNPDDPLCLFQTEDGSTEFPTGDMITKYYCYVTKLVFPTISEAGLKLFSTHLARLKMACLLHEAGKDGVYIKFRTRWLSDCFQIYLQNTYTIFAQHMAALGGDNADILRK